MSKRRCGYTLLEMLLVLAIVCLLSSIALPVFGVARGKAREVECISNLRQIGQGFALYMQDYDGRFPCAIDPVDRYATGVWSHFPTFKAEIPTLPMLHEALQPYVASRALFRCPGDSGFESSDISGGKIDAFPTSFEKYGTSYVYRTELAALKKHESEIALTSKINVLEDPSGTWHGKLIPPTLRYNVLFADGHVKNQSRLQLQEAWDTELAANR